MRPLFLTYHSCVKSSLLLCPEPEEGFTSGGLQQKHPTLPSTESFKTTSSQTAQARLQRHHPHTLRHWVRTAVLRLTPLNIAHMTPGLEERNMCSLIEFSVATQTVSAAARSKNHLKIHLTLSNNTSEATGSLYKHFRIKRETQINSNKDERRQNCFLFQLLRKHLIGGFFLSWGPEGLLIVSSALLLLWHVRPGSL